MFSNSRNNTCVLCGAEGDGRLCRRCAEAETRNVLGETTQRGKVKIIDVKLINIHLADALANAIAEDTRDYAACVPSDCTEMFCGRPIMNSDVAYHIPFCDGETFRSSRYGSIVVKLIDAELSGCRESVEQGLIELLKFSRKYPYPLHIWVTPEMHAKLPACLAYQANVKLFLKLSVDCNVVPQIVVYNEADDSYRFYQNEMI